MRIRVAVALSGFFCLLSTTFAQEGDVPLNSIDVSVTEEMVGVAQALLASTRTGVPQQGDRPDSGPNRVERMMGYSREGLLSLSALDESRRDWSYWPRPRVGLSLVQMNAEQRTLVHDLLTLTLSSLGYLKVVHVMQTDEILRAWEEEGTLRGKGYYWLSFFGTPSISEPWGWRFEGHHVSLNISVAPGSVRVTPTFFGADPAEVPQGTLAGFRPHAGIEDLGRDLVLSMSRTQREIVVLSHRPPRDIFAGNLRKPQDDWEAWRETLQPEGILVKDLSPEQRQIAQRILEEVVTTYRPEISSAYLKTIDIDDLSFAWMGGVERRLPHYYRLQGNDFVFEYDNVQDGANHIHTVWRSKAGDFGDDLLRDHYQTSHR